MNRPETIFNLLHCRNVEQAGVVLRGKDRRSQTITIFNLVQIPAVLFVSSTNFVLSRGDSKRHNFKYRNIRAKHTEKHSSSQQQMPSVNTEYLVQENTDDHTVATQKVKSENVSRCIFAFRISHFALGTGAASSDTGRHRSDFKPTRGKRTDPY